MGHGQSPNPFRLMLQSIHQHKLQPNILLRPTDDHFLHEHHRRNSSCPASMRMNSDIRFARYSLSSFSRWIAAILAASFSHAMIESSSTQSYSSTSKSSSLAVMKESSLLLSLVETSGAENLNTRQNQEYRRKTGQMAREDKKTTAGISLAVK